MTLLNIIAAVCLLLWGTRMVRLGFTRAYGANMRRIIDTGTKNRFTAFTSGALVTLLLQSSTATILLLSSFAKQHRIKTAAALAVIIGADVSTSIVAQILTFDLSWIAPLLLTAGIILHMMYEHGGRTRHIARVMIGLGFMLLALSLIRQAAAPLRDSETLTLILHPLDNEPALAILLAALLTWLAHSSLASVLLFASLAEGGAIGLELGLFMVLGANLGGALIALVSTSGDEPAARRGPLGNFIMRFAMAAVFLFIIPPAIPFLQSHGFTEGRQLVNFHMLFNIALALAFLPLVGPLGRVCDKAMPSRKKKKDPSQPQFLDEKALGTPVIALAGAARETLRMAETVEDMLQKTIITFQTNDHALVQAIRERDNVVDNLYNEIKLYLARLTQESLDPKESDRYLQIMTFATNLEYVGDVIDKSLMDLAEKKIRRQDNFSDEGFKEIHSFHEQVVRNMKLAQTIFQSEDPDLARELVERKKSVREAVRETSAHHFERLREGKPQTLATSSLHMDVIRDYRRINTYMTSVAYMILENASKHRRKRKTPAGAAAAQTPSPPPDLQDI